MRRELEVDLLAVAVLEMRTTMKARMSVNLTVKEVREE